MVNSHVGHSSNDGSLDKHIGLNYGISRIGGGNIRDPFTFLGG